MGRSKSKHKIMKDQRRHQLPEKVAIEHLETTKIFPKQKRDHKNPAKPTIKVLTELAEALTKKRKPKHAKAGRLKVARGARQTPEIKRAEIKRGTGQRVPALKPAVVVSSPEFRLDLLHDDGYLWRKDYQELLACSDTYAAVFDLDYDMRVAQAVSEVSVLMDMVFSSSKNEVFAGQIGSGYLWKREADALLAGYDGCDKLSALIDDKEKFFGVH